MDNGYELKRNMLRTLIHKELDFKICGCPIFVSWRTLIKIWTWT